MNDVVFELIAPNLVDLVNLLVLPDDERRQVLHKRLSGLGVLLRLQPIVLGLLRPVLLRLLVPVGALLLLRRENGRCGQDLVEVLELLARPLLVGVSNALAVNLSHIREAVNDERTQEDRV